MTSKHKGVPRRNKSLPAAIWTACEALSWGMFGDKTLPLTDPTPPNLPSPNPAYYAARR